MEAKDLGNAVIYAESVGEWGIPFSSNPADITPKSHIVGFPIAGRWSTVAILIMETLRFHIAKGKIQVQFLFKISSVIKEQVLEKSKNTDFRFVETSAS